MRGGKKGNTHVQRLVLVKDGFCGGECETFSTMRAAESQ